MKRLWFAVVLLLFAVAGVALYKGWPLLYPSLRQVAPLDPECDLRAGPCSGVLPEGGRITFAIKPESIPLVTPLAFEVRLEGLNASAVEIDFQGVGMNMGFNRPKLVAGDGGGYYGNGMLPVCVSDAMEWEAKVLVYTGDGIIAAPFRFITVKPGAELPTK